MKNVGVREISRQTGFSPATVSNALNHKRGVNTVTAEAILRTARDLGYTRQGHISNINFVMARKTGEVLDEGTFHTGVINGIAVKAQAEGVRTSFTTLELRDRVSAAAQASDIIHNTNSAVILLGTEMAEEDYDLFSNPETPLVVVDGTSDRIPLDAIVMRAESLATFSPTPTVRFSTTRRCSPLPWWVMARPRRARSPRPGRPTSSWASGLQGRRERVARPV